MVCAWQPALSLLLMYFSSFSILNILKECVCMCICVYLCVFVILAKLCLIYSHYTFHPQLQYTVRLSQKQVHFFCGVVPVCKPEPWHSIREQPRRQAEQPFSWRSDRRNRRNWKQGSGKLRRSFHLAALTTSLQRTTMLWSRNWSQIQLVGLVDHSSFILQCIRNRYQWEDLMLSRFRNCISIHAFVAMHTQVWWLWMRWKPNRKMLLRPGSGR